MDINRANMTALFQSFNTRFTEGMQRGVVLPAELQSERITLAEMAMLVPSSGAEEVHAWLNQIPGFRRWVGDRQKKDVNSNKLHVVNADWEDTIAVGRNDIEDDRYGLYAPRFESLGAEGSDNALWLDMAVDALLANGAWVDGKAFFVVDRKYGDNTINNVTATALSATTFDAGIAAMESHLGPANNPLGTTAVYLLVGPGQRQTAWDLVKNEFVSSGTGKGGAIQNRCRGRALLRVHPKLVGAYANCWYILGQKGNMKPVGVQRRKLPQMVAKDQLSDDNVFFNKEFIYGADARGEGFLTLPHLAYAGIVAP
jgi:phage major head subunit gpT-like protein